MAAISLGSIKHNAEQLSCHLQKKKRLQVQVLGYVIIIPTRLNYVVQDLFDTQTIFWRDSWLDDRSIEDIAPSLIALVSSRVKRSRTVAQALLTMGQEQVCQLRLSWNTFIYGTD
jgi:hypothetical protein